MSESEAPHHLDVTRTAYDTVAADYAELLDDELAQKPFDRAMLRAFAELVGDGPIGDLGCGPGRVTGYLSSLGADAFGLDLSPEMIAVARRRYPELRFEVGSILELPIADETLGGIVAWYSIIHTPPELLTAVFAEFHRVLVPGGHLLLAFQVGEDAHRLIQNAYGHTISLDAYALSPERIEERLSATDFRMISRTVREPEGFEKTPQAYLLATRN